MSRPIDPERLWTAVVQHVGVIPAHQHPTGETCGEAIVRVYQMGEECVQCGVPRRSGGHWWPTGMWSCSACFDSDFGS